MERPAFPSPTGKTRHEPRSSLCTHAGLLVVSSSQPNRQKRLSLGTPNAPRISHSNYPIYFLLVPLSLVMIRYGNQFMWTFNCHRFSLTQFQWQP